MQERLDGSEGGSWIVTTEGSEHWFDLDAMTVTRRPGPDAYKTINDRTRPIERIIKCAVGEHGYWLMKADGVEAEFIDGFWHVSSRILRIDLAPKEFEEP